MVSQTLVNDKNNPDAIKVDQGLSSFKYWLIGAGILVLGIIIYSLYNSNQSASRETLSGDLYKFEVAHLTPVVEKSDKADIDQMVSEYKLLLNRPAAKSGVLSTSSVEIADLLIRENKPRQAIEILKKSLKLTKNDFSRFFIISRLGVLEQNAGNLDSAISLYESLLTQKTSLMEEKTYLNLGVLYLKKGKLDKAKSSLNYVLEKSKDEVLLKLARIYLKEIK